MASVVSRTRVFLTAAHVESGDGTTTPTERRRRSKDVRGAAFAPTCLFSDETIWQLLNIEEDLKLEYRCHQAKTTVLMLVSSIFGSTLMFGANAVMQHE